MELQWQLFLNSIVFPKTTIQKLFLKIDTYLSRLPQDILMAV